MSSDWSENTQLLQNKLVYQIMEQLWLKFQAYTGCCDTLCTPFLILSSAIKKRLSYVYVCCRQLVTCLIDYWSYQW